ncbi:MAG: hypothetical protein ACE1ZM_05855, partial [Gammaproteobacteria bacterium]
ELCTKIYLIITYLIIGEFCEENNITFITQQLIPDGNTVEVINNIGIRFKAWRTGTKKVEPPQEIRL